MRLYVDGVLAASNPQTQAPARTTGYWRVGGDNTWGGSSSNYFAGIDRRGGCLLQRAERVDRPGALPGGWRHAAERQADGGVHLGRPVIWRPPSTAPARPTPTAPSRRTPGTSVTARHRHRVEAVAHLRRGRHVHRHAHRDRRRRRHRLGHPRRHRHGTGRTKPTAAFTSSTSDLAATFDGTGSTDADGTDRVVRLGLRRRHRHRTGSSRRTPTPRPARTPSRSP